MAGKAAKIDFEKALSELEVLVKRLEEGGVPLEDSIRQFESAMVLVKACQSALTAAEQKIEIISGKNSCSDASRSANGDKQS
jgi:exodeoxyribonuclease VII small subunit